MNHEILTLSDGSSGAVAKILPWFGFNCYQFTVQQKNRPIEVLWWQPGIETGQARASGSGIPILFPFPGRIPGTKFEWLGKTYDLESGDAFGNAIHGFVLNRPWRVIEHSGNRAVGQFQGSVDDPSLRSRWPSDFQITVTYELVGNSLKSRLLMKNTGEESLPCGIGTHPYFRLPVGGHNGGACRVKLPVHKHWELIDMLPTGRELPLPEASELQSGRPFADMKYDTVMSGLEFHNRRCVTEIADPESGVVVRQSFGDAFRECVVYTPPHREAICIEPYSCVPGAFHLHGQVVNGEKLNAGLRVVQPGVEFEVFVDIDVVLP